MKSRGQDSSLWRWFCSAVVTLFLLITFLFITLRKPNDAVEAVAPLMELEYVILEQPLPEKNNPPKKVQPKQVMPDQVKLPPEEALTIPTSDIPIELTHSPAQATDISAAPIKHTPVESTQPQRIGNISELDNTDFEPIYNPKPDYPIIAQEARITGYVDIDLTIDENGKVASFSIVKTQGHMSFALETAKVLPRWRFPPPRIGGKKVKVQYVYRINFTLN